MWESNSQGRGNISTKFWRHEIQKSSDMELGLYPEGKREPWRVLGSEWPNYCSVLDESPKGSVENGQEGEDLEQGSREEFCGPGGGAEAWAGKGVHGVGRRSRVGHENSPVVSLLRAEIRRDSAEVCPRLVGEDQARKPGQERRGKGFFSR